MGLNLPKNFWGIIQKSRLVLITFPPTGGGDAIAGALALKRMLKKSKVDADIVSQDFVVPSKLKFLLGIEEIKNKILHLNKFLIKLDVSKNQIEEFSYDIADQKLNIFITAKNGNFVPQDVTTSSTDYRYDLIITLKTAEPEDLGKIYEENTDFFYKTPVLNIDHAHENEQHGHINVVDMTASSVSEIIYTIFKGIQPEIFDEPTATTLLTGIFSETKGFRSSQITPQLLEIVSELVAAGARRDDIVHHLYRTKSIETLKIWGKTLSNLKYEPDLGLVWAGLTAADIAGHAQNEETLKEIVEELINNSPEAKIICLLYETPEGNVHCLANSDKGIDAMEMAHAFHPTGSHNAIKFAVEKSNIQDTSERIVTELRKKMPRVVNTVA